MGTQKKFHISDVLSVTTGRLVSSRHMDGIYEILNFLTGDNLFTHQLPRAMRECEPWLKSQFPYLMPDSPQMATLLERLKSDLAKAGQDRAKIQHVIFKWVGDVRQEAKPGEVLPEMLPVYKMGEGMHTHIDPITEAQAMVGDDKVIAVKLDE